MKAIKIAVSFALVFTLFPSVFDNVKVKGSKKELATLLLVPLDDRPANLYLPQQVGKSAGVNVITPPEDIIGNYNDPGKVDEISHWILKNGDDVDGFVLSTSMLAYGGLIASRTGKKSLKEAMGNIQVIKEIKGNYPDKPIYAYDTIQRLAVTAMSEESAEYYLQIREWAILYDKVHNLDFEVDRPRLEELESKIPNEVLKDYLNTRARNYEVNKLLIDWVEDDYIDYLILAQDDAEPYGLHRAEREVLIDKVENQKVNDRVTIFPGADEVDAVLVARSVSKIFNVIPSFYVEYGGIHGEDWVPLFEDITFDENVQKHIMAAGGEITESEPEADIHLILNTPTQNDNERQADISGMVNRVVGLINDKKQVAIGDVLMVNKADESFVKQLSNKVDLTKILSYSGWNTAGNALGITVGHAVSRNAFLNHNSGFSVQYYKKAAKAHYEFLLLRFAKDQGYKNAVQPAINQYISEIGANPWNLGKDYDEVNQFVRKQLISETENWYRHFDGKKVRIGSKGNKCFYSTISELESVHVELPWPRVFEVELEPKLKLGEAEGRFSCFLQYAGESFRALGIFNVGKFSSFILEDTKSNFTSFTPWRFSILP